MVRVADTDFDQQFLVQQSAIAEPQVRSLYRRRFGVIDARTTDQQEEKAEDEKTLHRVFSEKADTMRVAAG
jgi:hypothetical protein